MKYEGGVSLYSGEFVWAPLPGVRGASGDQTCFKNYGMATHMLDEEKFLGDTHYCGLPKSLCPTVKYYKDNKIILGKVRSIVEHAFRRVKIFQCMEVPWRHNITGHERAFKVCVHITNVIFRTHPLHKEHNPLLLRKL